MKYLLILAALIAIALAFSSCHTTCPPDEKIGDLSLDPESAAYIPYAGNEKLIFKNSEGEEIVFTSDGYSKEKNRVSVYKICTEVKFDGQSTYKYFDSEIKSIVFFANEKYAFNAGIFTDIIRPEKELFYDRLRIGLSSEGSIGNFEMVTKIRFTEPYEESEIYIVNPVVKLDSITLGGTTYYDVLASESEEFGQIFYTKEKGLVGFRHWSEMYYLDRIE